MPATQYRDPLAGVAQLVGFDDNVLTQMDLAFDDPAWADQKQRRLAFAAGGNGHGLPGCRIVRQPQLGGVRASGKKQAECHTYGGKPQPKGSPKPGIHHGGTETRRRDWQLPKSCNRVMETP